jgi:hypothetical protein
MPGGSGKSGNPITDYNNHKKGKKGKLSAQEALGIEEVPAEQVKAETKTETLAPASLEQQLANSGVSRFESDRRLIGDKYGLSPMDIVEISNRNTAFTHSANQSPEFAKFAYDDIKYISDADLKALFPYHYQELIKGKNTVLDLDKQAGKKQTNPSEKSAEGKTLDDVWADSLGIPRSELNSAKPNIAEQPAANPEKVIPEKVVAQDMVDKSQTEVSNPYVGFNWGSSNRSLPFYNKNEVNRPIPNAIHAPLYNRSTLEPPAPYEYNPIVKRNAAERA